MSHYRAELARQLEEQEAGVADLVAAYEAAEVAYFAAVAVSTPVATSFIAANSSGWGLRYQHEVNGMAPPAKGG